MKISSFNEKIRRDAENKFRNKFLRVAFFISLCAFLSFANSSCVDQTKNAAQKSIVEQKSPAETKHQQAANAPRVTQADDAKIKQILKPSGKPLLVNFWATWCGPCREEFPDFVRIDTEYRGKIDFFTVSLDFIEEIDTTVPEFLREMNAEMPTYLLTSGDENALISSISKDWSGALPFTILYNEKGEVKFTRQGKFNYETLKSEIEKTVSEKNDVK